MIKEWAFAVHVWFMLAGYIWMLSVEVRTLRETRLQLDVIEHNLLEVPQTKAETESQEL